MDRSSRRGSSGIFLSCLFSLQQSGLTEPSFAWLHVEFCGNRRSNRSLDRTKQE
jgi:hypothetical protein